MWLRLVTWLVQLAWRSLVQWQARIKILHDDCSNWFDYCCLGYFKKKGMDGWMIFIFILSIISWKAVLESCVTHNNFPCNQIGFMNKICPTACTLAFMLVLMIVLCTKMNIWLGKGSTWYTWLSNSWGYILPLSTGFLSAFVFNAL